MARHRNGTWVVSIPVCIYVCLYVCMYSTSMYFWCSCCAIHASWLATGMALGLCPYLYVCMYVCILHQCTFGVVAAPSMHHGLPQEWHLCCVHAWMHACMHACMYSTSMYFWYSCCAMHASWLATLMGLEAGLYRYVYMYVCMYVYVSTRMKLDLLLDLYVCLYVCVIYI